MTATDRPTTTNRWWRTWWPSITIGAAATVLTVWSASPPGGYLDIAFVALIVWLTATILWLLATILTLVKRSNTLWPYLAFPILLIATITTARSGVIPTVMFDLHRPALQRLADDVTAAPDHRVPTQRVGLFTMRTASANRTTGCVMLPIRDAGFLDTTGFAHCPTPPPADDRQGDHNTSYRHLDGPWYTYSETW